MDVLPVLLDGETVGKVQLRQEGLYLAFCAECRVCAETVYHLFAVGEQGRIALGVPEPCGEKLTLTRRVSCREAGTAGKLLRTELRRGGEDADGATRWQTVSQPERLFRSSFLCEQVRGVEGVLFARGERGFRLALPYDRRRPFLLTSLFCLARVETVDGKAYAVFSFDRHENPRLP